jgi:hypothetical protein
MRCPRPVEVEVAVVAAAAAAAAVLPQRVSPTILRLLPPAVEANEDSSSACESCERIRGFREGN